MTETTSKNGPSTPAESAPSTGAVCVGILGAGQLGRMLGLAAIRMGLSVRFLDRAQSGATEGLGETHVGDWTDPEVLRRFIQGCAVITTENEWAPAAAVEAALRDGDRDGGEMRPGSRSLDRIADKGRQKQTLEAAGIPTAPFALAADEAEAARAFEALGGAVMLKRRRGSYDGYGNHTAHDAAALREGWTRLHGEDGLLLEQWVPFERELSVIVARSTTGEVQTYPVAYTEQRDHRCHATVVPAGVPDGMVEAARRIGRDVVQAFDLVGVTAVELFATEDGRLLVNEVAPRPHNTGHYTIEGCVTSQFENHLRAVLGWPLGATDLRAPAAVMINLIGDREGEVALGTLPRALSSADVAVHCYGKRDVRPRRKMGHVTCLGDDPTETRARAEAAAEKIQL